METEVSKGDVISELQFLINQYLESYPQMSLNALAMRSNVPVSTLRRISLGQQKSDLAPHNVLNLTSYLLKEKNLSKLLKRVSIPIHDYLYDHFGSFIFNETERTYDVDLNFHLQDQHYYFIYKLAANHKGTNLSEIIELFGRLGEVKIKEMLDLGLLLQEGENLHAKEKNFSLDLKIAGQHLPELVRFYRPESMAQGLNLLYSMSESLNEEAIQKIKNIQREAALKVADIMDNQDNWGEIPYFSLTLSESFTLQYQGEIQ